ncbi:MAG: MmcQ/YjbR family DNA-binding protein [Eubacteriales bacterium]|nr:MmcQ/YjbR family DNA-binding protein [Eubacteriales bacterium]
MDRNDVARLIRNAYGVEPETPWPKYPGNQVYRGGSGKWFALVMDVAAEKLGLPGDGNMEIMNVKCDPALLGSLLSDEGFFPAYHMNKANWISVVLNEKTDGEAIRFLLRRSFELTGGRQSRPKKE